MSNTNPARGMRDFLPADVRRREYVINIVKEVYERYGFEPLETPAVENIETLTGKYGEEGNQLIFKILKRGEHEKTGEADLALRYDLTVPLARVVAQYKNDLPKFFKRYQIQPVWRADRPARGRFREFYQCDVDAIGSKSMIVEAELCAAVSDVLVRLGFNDFVILLNHREVLRGILEVSGISEEKQSDALVALDKFDKIGESGVLRELVQRGVFTEESGNHFLKQFMELMMVHMMPAHDFPDERTNEEKQEEANAIILEKLNSFIGQNESGKFGLEAVKQILNFTQNSSASGRIRVQPSLARGLSYYTGAIFEIGLNRLDFQGSIAGGGRYDNLVRMFSGQDVPACGFSLGLERIIVVMTERGMFPDDLVTTSADCMVTIWNEETISDSLALANELRQSGLRVELYPEADKLGKQFKYASSRGINFVCVIGDDERANNKVTLKNMTTGEQETIARNEIAAKIKNG